MRVALIESHGSDETIVASARQSTDSAFRGWGTQESPGDERLLKYLYDHHHDSVFEFAGMTVKIEAPIFVARQIFRHRAFSFTEVSGRYVELKNDVCQVFSWRQQAAKNRQSSAGTIASQGEADDAYRDSCAAAWASYARLIALGVCREQARMVLPLATMTQWLQTGNLRSWLAFLELRLASDAQQETREVAEQIASLVRKSFPRTAALALR